MTTRLAGIVVFAFNRPDHVRRALDALEANPEAAASDVVVFIDGPRDNEHDALLTTQVAEEVARPRRFRSLSIVKRPSNLGLSNSITSGISQALESFESIVVVEDDIVVSPAFLSYMNDGLTRFRDDHRVVSIHGYSYPVGISSPFFLRGADCWGWGTWRRGWDIYRSNAVDLLAELYERELSELFDFEGAYSYTNQLIHHIVGVVDSWDTAWYASAFLADKLTLYPGQTLVKNIGFDGSGTNASRTNRFSDELAQTAPDLSAVEVRESEGARGAFESFFLGQKKRNILKPLASRCFKFATGLYHQLLRR